MSARDALGKSAIYPDQWPVEQLTLPPRIVLDAITARFGKKKCATHEPFTLVERRKSVGAQCVLPRSKGRLSM
jgi:hypothetical protein